MQFRGKYYLLRNLSIKKEKYKELNFMRNNLYKTYMNRNGVIIKTLQHDTY